MANYPDILGEITKGARLTIDLADVAFGIRPGSPVAGQIFEALLIIQNNSGADLDAQVRLIIPERDLSGTRNRFATKADKKIVVGLRPAEVGYVSLPAIASPQSTPGAGYQMQIEVEIKREDAAAQQVRTPRSNAAATENVLSDAARAEVDQLKALSFSVATQGKQSRTSVTLSAPFTLQPAGISQLEQPPRAGWKSLWTVADFNDEADLASQARVYTSVVTPQLNRAQLFVPLLSAIQHRAEAAGYRLWAGEATVIAKLMLLVLETGQLTPNLRADTHSYPQWFLRMCQELLNEPTLAQDVPKLIAERLFTGVLFEAALAAFTALRSNTTEDLGSADEMHEYALSLAASFSGQGAPFDYVRVYLPLVMGGILSNARLTMPGEHALDALEMLINARIKREPERNEDNQFAFNLHDDLMDRALSQIDGQLNLQRYLDPIERLRVRRY